MEDRIMNKEDIAKKLEEYKVEFKKVAENRDRMVMMVQQSDQKLQQLNGAIIALEDILKEGENAGSENPSTTA
jgi:hypothetical protein